MNTRVRQSLIAALIIVLAALLLASPTLAKKSVFDQLDLLVDIRHEIVTEYVEEPDQEAMVQAAVKAMVESLDDPYTQFLMPEDLEGFEKHVRGSFSGIGAEVDIHDNRLRIVSPLEDSPAWKAGVMPGDIVLEIDGQTTEGMKINECVKRLTGQEGTDVTIKVRHETGEEATMTITRARIVVETIRGLRRDHDLHWDFMFDKPNKIGYVRVTQFAEQTDKALKKVIDDLVAQGLQGLIIDVRFNPGGLLESAVAVSDMFLGKDQTIVSIKGRVVEEKVHKSTGGGVLQTVPLVVLANEASASAAEILTGALADNQRAQFVGTRTFGKGSVQQVRMLEGGQGALKITNAYYYLPSGRNIHRKEDAKVWGVDPADGFYVPMNPDQLKEMIRVRQEHKALRPNNNGEFAEALAAITPEWIETELKDPQLAAGLRALRGKIQAGDWPQVGQSGAEQLALESRRQVLLRQREMLQERLQEIQDELAGKTAAADKGEPEENGEDAEQPAQSQPGEVAPK